MLSEKTIFKITAIISASLLFVACSSTSEVQKLAQRSSRIPRVSPVKTNFHKSGDINFTTTIRDSKK